MDLHTPQQGLYPYYISKCFYQGEILESQEEIKIESRFQFNALLEEVKQYNSDFLNKDKDKYIKIQ